MDDLRKKTDKELQKMEKKLAKIYKEAEKDLTKKWDEYMGRAEKRIEKYEKALADAKQSGDKESIAQAEEELKRRREAVLYKDEWYRKMVEQTAEKYSDVNSIAVAYVNDKMPGIYTMNLNGTLQDINSDLGKVGQLGVSFNLVDEHTVRNLVKSDKSLFPQKVINKAKDMKWNLKAINSQVTQGILQGESIPQIQKRLQNVTDMNSAAAIRSARTMCTTAENNGRLSGIKEAEEQGIVYEKQWMATHDERTRESHAELDGESVPIDEEFSNGLQYPGDPNGEPEEVYNCRCSMVRKLIGFRREDGSVSEVGDIKSYEPHYFQKAEPEEKTENATEEAEDWRSEKAEFTPAKTIEEAEGFAKSTFIDGGGFNLTGKTVSFKGIDVETANEINSTLNDIYNKFNIDKLSSIESYGKRDKRAYSKNSDAPFFTTNMGNLGINNTIASDMTHLEKYAASGAEAFNYVIANMDALSGLQLELAKTYQKAGRSLVDSTVNGMVTHEVGHHITYMPDINKAVAEIQKSDTWKEYAQELSGYANHSFGEYMAESFSAYYKGEEDKIQPELLKIFEGLRKK